MAVYDSMGGVGTRCIVLLSFECWYLRSEKLAFLCCHLNHVGNIGDCIHPLCHVKLGVFVCPVFAVRVTEVFHCRWSTESVSSVRVRVSSATR